MNVLEHPQITRALQTGYPEYFYTEWQIEDDEFTEVYVHDKTGEVIPIEQECMFGYAMDKLGLKIKKDKPEFNQFKEMLVDWYFSAGFTKEKKKGSY